MPMKMDFFHGNFNKDYRKCEWVFLWNLYVSSIYFNVYNSLLFAKNQGEDIIEKIGLVYIGPIVLISLLCVWLFLNNISVHVKQ
jgi:uncharacterized membrane protein